MTNKEREYILALATVLDIKAENLDYDSGLGNQFNHASGMAHGYRSAAGMIRNLISVMEQDAKEGLMEDEQENA